MSFLSALKGIGKAALNIGTGGIAGSVIDALGSAGGAQQAGAAKGRADEAALNQRQDANAIDLYRTRQDAEFQAAKQDLERKAFATKDRGDVFRQALLAELLPGYEGVSVAGVPQASGGLIAALKRPGALEAIQAMGAQAKTAQAAPQSFAGGNVIAAPSLTPMPTQSGGSKTLDAITRIAQIAGAAGRIAKKSRPAEEDGL